jgi:hypothetical protein
MMISGLRGVSGIVSLSVVSVIPVIVGVLYLVSARLTRGSTTTPHDQRPLHRLPTGSAGPPAGSSPHPNVRKVYP